MQMIANPVAGRKAEKVGNRTTVGGEGANLCVRRPLELKGKWMRGEREAANKEACTLFSSGSTLYLAVLVPVSVCLRLAQYMLFSLLPER
jgi:hypothetical protein